MKHLFTLICIFVFIQVHSQNKKTPIDYVNVFTGTSNSRWQLFPGATLPFGMVKLSPDNQENVWNGGYEYTINSIAGFSHLHAMSLSGLSLMPVTGAVSANEGWVKSYSGSADGPFGGMWTAGFRSRFKKETEHASPNYYSVDLYDANVKAELTSTMRCGMMRFTYPKAESHIFMDFDFAVEEKNEILDAHFEKVSDTEVRGYVKQKNTYVPEITVYYVLQLNKPLTSCDAWLTEKYSGKDNGYGTSWRDKRTLLRDIKTFDGKSGNGIILNFDTKEKDQVIARTGISFVSLDQAKLNLDTEIAPYGFDFDKVVKAGQDVWNKLLGTVEVFTKNDDDKVKFYTNLYRTYSGKSAMNDVDGKYRDACHKIRTLKDKSQSVYTSDALWGTQWDLTPLWTLLNPDIAESFINSLLELSDIGGWIPYAPTGLAYSPIMGAQHQNSLIISAYQKGLRGFDANKAYNAILHDYTTPGEEYKCGGFAGNRHLKPYMELGFVPDEKGPASNTMEYAYDDWAFSQYAKALGKPDVAQKFYERSMNYKNLFNPETKFVGQKHTDGTWTKPFNPYKFGTVGGWNGTGFMEGTPFQYSFFVPHDVNGMMNLMGRDSFIHRLEYGFENNLFDLGNQPCMETPFLFSYAGKPWLTQKYTRQIANDLFDTSPYRGWVGEEDEGQMSAYYVLVSLGLFEMDGGCSTKPFYNLTTPVFDKIVIHLDKKYGSKTFTIESSNNLKQNNYIQSAMLNGKAINRAWIYHDEIIKGGTLKLTLGKSPNEKWGLEKLTN